jgi:hypothetical protein
VIPKFHGAKLTDIPDEDLRELLVREERKKTQAEFRATRLFYTFCTSLRTLGDKVHEL